MTNELTLLTKENFGGIELDLYRNEDDEIFMTVSQLAQALGYSSKGSLESLVSRNPRVKESEFSVVKRMQGTDEKSYRARVFTEDGIYEVTMLSKRPEAKEFRFFVRELLKGLRKSELQIKSTPRTYVEALRALADVEEEKEKLTQEIVGLYHKIGLMKPKVGYLDTILTSTDALNVTQIAKDYGLSGRKLNQLLSEEHIQYKTGGQWMLYQKYAGKGYVKWYTHSFDKPDGSQETSLQMKWTKKGRLLIHNILTTKGYVAEMDKEKEIE